ncbi:Endonuclease/exonuclease/phosphatase [Lipomyces kononenkoae]|uniref:Endonuclease/exonuclease/phosphatase n=1 Tax=Lipomyces kononenkoae TaxID=34357 RepID=A0ACC3SVE3_LIPKO
MTDLVLSTSTHTLTFHPCSSDDNSGGTVDTPFYILEPKLTAADVTSSTSPVQQPAATDLTVHDSISIDEDDLDPDNLLLKLQDRDIGSVSKSDVSYLAEFVFAWRSALATLEEHVQVKQVSSFENPLNSGYVTARLSQARHSFVEEKVVQIRLITWNLHGEVIGEDLRPLLFGSNVLSDTGELDDLGIFFLALQEADPLTPTMISANQATITRWSNQVLEALGESYVMSASSELLGMVLLMFSHKKLASQITQLELSSAGTGVLGYWGNKGAVCIRFILGQSRVAGIPGVEIAVVNMHLSSGMSPQSVERRRWEMSELDRRLKLPVFNGRLFRKQRNGGKNRKELLYQNGDLLDELDERVLDISDDDIVSAAADAISAMNVISNGSAKPYEAEPARTPPADGSDTAATISTATSTTATTAVTVNTDQVGPEREINSIVFALGDLNYRLAMDRSDISLLAAKNDYDALLFWDQLRSEIKDGSILVGFQEGPIAFQPTYKYDIGTNTFDTSEKARVPAYTDRILYTSYPSLAQLDYETFMHYFSSDHKPVAATFELRTMLMDVDKRAQIVKRLLHDLDVRENESRPKVEVDKTDLICPDLPVLSTINQAVKFRNCGNTQVAWETEIVDGSLLEVLNPQGIVPPGGTQIVRVSCKVPPNVTSISEIFILRIINRQDYFISINGNVLPSCFGASLTDMINKPSGARNGFLAPQVGGPQLNIPREIWKCINFLSTRITRDIFRRPGDETVGQLVRDWLDNGDDFDCTVLDSLAKDGNKGTHSVAEQFLMLLELVNGGVIPEKAYDIITQGEDGVPLIFEAMPRVNVNTLIYIASFLREVKRVVLDFESILEVFDKVLVRIPKTGKNKSRQKKKRIEFWKGFVG